MRRRSRYGSSPDRHLLGDAVVSHHSFRLADNSKTIDLFAEDAVEAMPRRIEPGSVDVVVTSPPYNLGTAYREYRDDIPRSDYLDWTRSWVARVRDAMSDTASLFLNVGSKPLDPWVPFEIAEVIRPLLSLQNVIHWVKSIAIDKKDVGAYGKITDDIAVGHYKPINSPRFLNDCHEYVFHFTKGGDAPLDRLAVGVPYQDKSNVARWKNASGGLRCRGNTWFLPYETIMNRDRDRPHPASFPVALPEMCIRLHGLERTRRVLDPFTGIGATAVACARLGCAFVGFDIDGEYLSVAARRIREELTRLREQAARLQAENLQLRGASPAAAGNVALLQENTRLRRQIERLKSDLLYIERVARERYGMARPGERVYRVIPPRSRPESAGESD